MKLSNVLLGLGLLAIFTNLIEAPKKSKFNEQGTKKEESGWWGTKAAAIKKRFTKDKKEKPRPISKSSDSSNTELRKVEPRRRSNR